MLKPAGSLIFFISVASSASDEPVGGPDGGASPFWASVSSPRNQSSGGWVQNSLVPDSYFFNGFCCALAWLAPATTRIAVSARIDRLKADFIASLPYAAWRLRLLFILDVSRDELGLVKLIRR